VHPTEKEIIGLKAYPTIDDLPETPDLAFMVLPTDIVAGILDQCGRAGVRAAVVVSGGFRETGGDGRSKEQALVEVARKHDIALIGPNCIGVSNFNIGLNTTYFPYEQEPGNVTVVSQSGTYSCHIYYFTKKVGIKLSHTVSVGNSAVTDLSDCLAYFADEPTTRAIALYIEGIKDGDKFLRVARDVVRKKPVVAVYVGGTRAGARAGLSHTGAMAGDDAIYDGVFREAGIIRAYSVQEMLDRAWALSMQPVPPGKRICVLTNAGGPGATMADSCNRAGLEVPLLSEGLQSRLREMLPHTAAYVNPVDMTYYMNFEAMYVDIPRMLMESGEIDGIVMYGVFGSMLYRKLQEGLGDRVTLPVERIMPTAIKRLLKLKELPNQYGKPLLISSLWGKDDDALEFLVDNGIPVYPTPERAVDAMAALYRYGEVRRR
jgi:acetyltransferase